MPEKETTNEDQIAVLCDLPEKGRLIGLDPGLSFIGIAVSDASQTIASPVRTIVRTSWKKTLMAIRDIVAEFDAVGVVIGLPYNFDGTESAMSAAVRDEARKLSLSLSIPVILQDERLTSYEARKRLWERGVSTKATKSKVDAEAASIILEDLLDRLRSIRSLSK